MQTSIFPVSITMISSDKIYVVSIPGIISETHGCLLLYDISNGIKPYNLQYVDIDLKLDQLQVFRLT